MHFHLAHSFIVCGVWTPRGVSSITFCRAGVLSRGAATLLSAVHTRAHLLFPLFPQGDKTQAYLLARGRWQISFVAAPLNTPQAPCICAVIFSSAPFLYFVGETQREQSERELL